MSFARSLSSALLVASILFFSAGAHAQIQRIPNSGCPGMPYVDVTGSATLGGQIQCACPPSIDRMRVLLGVPGVRIVFNTPLACVNGCSLDMNLLFFLQSPGVRATIPNDRTLLGTSVNVQCLQSSLNRPCLLLTGAVQITVQ